MEDVLQNSFIAGVERLTAWADLLDSINIFPVADGDTGRNLSISLFPLRTVNPDKSKIVQQLLFSARGNSGNIAARFFSAFYMAKSVSELAPCAIEGREKAWKAVSDPCRGTMLTVFDALSEALPSLSLRMIPDQEKIRSLVNLLEKSVHETKKLLPKLKKARVVDAGALGIYIFFEGFFYSLAGMTDNYRSVTDVFKNSLRISPFFREETETGYCVDFILKSQTFSKEDLTKITQTQDNAVIIPEGDLYKIHLHTDNRERMKAQIGELGSVLNWEEDNLAVQIKEFMNAKNDQTLNIMTDAAGSVTRKDAKKYGLTLLNSYLTVGEKCLPETYFNSEEVYSAMRQGVKVSTSQASVYERHQYYESVSDRFEKILYLCVGSVFTGNYNVVMEWKKKHDSQNKLLVIDTGAASGRLGIIALAVARYLNKTNNMEKTFAFAQRAVQICEEYVFLDKLQYLAAGGRLSKPSAFFGDMLKMKPVISPQPEGAKKVGVVRNQKEQLKMAKERLAISLRYNSQAFVMLEYSDNYEWVKGTVKKLLMERYPQAEVILQPLSLTSGAHMGPGTWAVAFLPEMD
jgi:DegV family protein with EDD domain